MKIELSDDEIKKIKSLHCSQKNFIITLIIGFVIYSAIISLIPDGYKSLTTYINVGFSTGFLALIIQRTNAKRFESIIHKVSPSHRE
jgi:hypothetical protein